MSDTCEHESNGFQLYREVGNQTWWQKMIHGTNVTLHWYCWKCGIELKPVWKTK